MALPFVAAVLLIFVVSLAVQAQRRERERAADPLPTAPAEPRAHVPSCHPPYDRLVQACRNVLIDLQAADCARSAHPTLAAHLQALAAALPVAGEEPQALALQGRWFEHRRGNMPQALIHQLAIALGRDGTAEPEFTRAAGQLLCTTCGTSYYDHPRHPYYSCLTLLCDGSCVKT